jgi:hypothetical protein
MQWNITIVMNYYTTGIIYLKKTYINHYMIKSGHVRT